MAMPTYSGIVLICEKLLDGRRPVVSPDLIKEAENEYKEIRKITGNAKEVEAIDEMLVNLRNRQERSAKSHAMRAQDSISFIKKFLKTSYASNTGTKVNQDVHGSVDRGGTNYAPREPPPDYNGPRQPDSRHGRGYERQKSRENDERLRIHLDQLSASKEASTRLRKNNPDLTDLSDKDRPTKLADKYTELYDNEWTDAFEELQNTCRLPEEQAVSLLLSILMEAYARNRRKAHEQFKDMESVISNLMTKFKATMAEAPPEMKGDTEALKQYRRSLSKMSLPELQRTFENPYLIDILDKYRCSNSKTHKTVEYARKCVELTWLMSVQDPPLVLDHLEGRHHFDTQLYKAFMKQGGKTVKYYVWPALLLHEDGPILAKGVAQG